MADIYAALARDIPNIPSYEPAVEITTTDALAESIKHGARRSRHAMEQELKRRVEDKTWTWRMVRLPDGKKAAAYRPVK